MAGDGMPPRTQAWADAKHPWAGAQQAWGRREADLGTLGGCEADLGRLRSGEHPDSDHIFPTSPALRTGNA